MSSIVQQKNPALLQHVLQTEVWELDWSPPHISLMYYFLFESVVGEVYSHSRSLVFSTKWRILDWNALKKNVIMWKLKEKLVFSTSQEDKFDFLLRPNRNIFILYYKFTRDCCFVLNEPNICKAITIIITNNVWTLLDRQGLTPCMYKMGEYHSPINLENMLINLSSYIYSIYIYIFCCAKLFHSLTICDVHMCSFFSFHTIKWYAINVCNCLQWVSHFSFGLSWQFLLLLWLKHKESMKTWRRLHFNPVLNCFAFFNVDFSNTPLITDYPEIIFFYKLFTNLPKHEAKSEKQFRFSRCCFFIWHFTAAV